MSSSGDGAPVTSAADGLLLRSMGDEVLLGVRAAPSSARTAVRGVYGDRLKISLTAAPEDGRANAQLVEALCAGLGLARAQVRIHAGHGNREKVVAFTGIEEERLRERLSTLLDVSRGRG